MGKKDTFRDRVALITGAASGIGRALSIELAGRASRLILVDINADKLEELRGELRLRGARVETIVADMSDRSAVLDLADTAWQVHGGIDYLFNNAGTALVGSMKETTLEEWERLVELNLWGPIRLTHTLLPKMIDGGGGHIVVTASLAGLVGTPGFSAYSMTKFAMTGAFESLSIECAGDNIHVSIICPGYVRTDLVRSSTYANKTMEDMLKTAPSWYGTTPESAARAIVRGVRKRRLYILVGPETSAWYLKRLSPRLYHAITRFASRAGGL